MTPQESQIRNEQTTRVWSAFSDRLRRFIRNRVSSDDDADDVLQDVFCRIHQRVHQLEQAERLQAWLYQVARHAVIDYYRRRSTIPPPSDFPEDLADAPAHASIIGELEDCLHPMIERLPASDRQVVMMSDIQGLKQREVADALGLSLSGAKSRVQRARAKLKAMFLECCHFEFDRLGNVLAYQPKSGVCPRCTGTRPGP